MSAPQKCESPAATGQCATNQKTLIDSTAEKSATTLIAKFALAGHQVHRLESGFLVCRWGQTRHCRDLAELVGFARQTGVLK